MVKRCIVGGCSQTAVTGVSMHRLPKALKVRQQWIRQLRTTRADLTPEYFTAGNPANLVVCSNHFKTDDFLSEFLKKEKFGLKGSKRLKLDAVPSVFAHRETLTHPQASSTPKGKGAFEKKGAPTETQTVWAKQYRSIGVQVTDLQPAVPIEHHDTTDSSSISNSTAEMLADKSDAVYLPPPSSSSCTSSSFSSQDDKNCSDPYRQLTERKFIVFMSSLLALFGICRSCKGPAQGQVCQEVGTCISIRQ